MASAIRAWAVWKPKARRVISRIWVLIASTRAFERPCSIAASEPDRGRTCRRGPCELRRETRSVGSRFSPRAADRGMLHAWRSGDGVIGGIDGDPVNPRRRPASRLRIFGLLGRMMRNDY